MDLVNKKIDYQLVSGKEGSNSSLLTVRKSCGNVIGMQRLIKLNFFKRTLINKIYLICLTYGNALCVEEAETNLAVAFLEKSNSYNHSNTVSSTCFSFNQPVSTE